MRLRSYLGVLLAIGVVVVASFLTHANRELLSRDFVLVPGRAVPLWAALLLVFLAGFLPTLTTLFVQTLKRDLAARRERQRSRETTSLKGGLRRALDLCAETQWARAATELEALLAETPDDFVALLRHGEALRQLGRAADAVEVHRRASVLYPQSVVLLYELAEDYDALGEAEVAREIRSRVLRDFPGMGLPLLRRRRDQLVAEGQYDEAARTEDRIDAVLKDTPAAARPARDALVAQGLRYQRGVAALENDRVAEALEIFRALVAESPSFIPARLMLGEAELVRDDENAALAAWRDGFAATGNPVFLQRLQDYFIEAEQPERAIELSHQLVAAAGRGADLLPRLFLGRLYFRLEMLDEAQRVLETLGERIQHAPIYHFLRGRIHERRGEMRRATDAYLSALRELGIERAEYRCRLCGTGSPEWVDRCESCGAWGTLEFRVEEARIPEEARRREAALWAGFEDPADDWAPPAAAPPGAGETAQGS